MDIVNGSCWWRTMEGTSFEEFYIFQHWFKNKTNGSTDNRKTNKTKTTGIRIEANRKLSWWRHPYYVTYLQRMFWQIWQDIFYWLFYWFICLIDQQETTDLEWKSAWNNKWNLEQCMEKILGKIYNELWVKAVVKSSLNRVKVKWRAN